jgi:DNA polymerase-3 subunit epsilon
MESSWHDGRLVAFDLETTGVDVDEARIVTACVAFVGGGEETDTHCWVADPGIEIPDEAAEVHGYTTARAQAEGKPAKETVQAILEALDARPTGSPIIAFNARFDFTVLDREARRHGLVPLGERERPLLVVDPLVIDKHIHKFRKGSRKLDAVSEHYDVGLDNAHDAAADALAAARVAWRIGHRGTIVRNIRGARDEAEFKTLLREWEAVRHDIVLLHDAQARWAAEQAASLEDYFRKEGKLESPVPRSWPVVPVGVPA